MNLNKLSLTLEVLESGSKIQSFMAAVDKNLHYRQVRDFLVVTIFLLIFFSCVDFNLV